MAVSHSSWRALDWALAGNADWLPPGGKQCRKALHPQKSAGAIISRSLRIWTVMLPVWECPESKWTIRDEQERQNRSIEIGRIFSAIFGCSLRNIAIAVFWKPDFPKIWHCEEFSWQLAQRKGVF